MAADWYTHLQAQLDSAHWGLFDAKSAAPLGSDYERSLKYVLRGFRAGAALVEETAPADGETPEAYVARILPLLDAIPESANRADREDVRQGVREVRLVLGRVKGAEGVG